MTRETNAQAEHQETARTDPAEEDLYRSRFSDLETGLFDAVCWVSLLDEIVDRMDYLPSMTREQLGLAHGQLQRVSDALKRTVGQLDADYHRREPHKDLCT
jgi:hypothetical protein